MRVVERRDLRLQDLRRFGVAVLPDVPLADDIDRHGRIDDRALIEARTDRHDRVELQDVASGLRGGSSSIRLGDRRGRSRRGGLGLGNEDSGKGESNRELPPGRTGFIF